MGLFDKFKEGLTKTRDFFSQGFAQIQAVFSGDDDELIEELEMLFIQADMGQKTTERVLSELREDLKRSHNKDKQHIRSVLKASMLELLGEKKTYTPQTGQLQVIFMVGVNGTGKTTTVGKLAMRYKKQGFKVLVAAADTFRAAAIEQLAHWSKLSGTEVVSHKAGADPAAVVYDAVQAAVARKSDLLLIDTAGRLHNKQNLMDELAKMRRIIDKAAPGTRVETMLVIDATTGQNALLQAEAFSKIVDLSGLIITKLDGNAKGGVTLAVADLVKVPIYFAGLGEQADDLVDFDPAYFVDSLLPEEGGI